MCWKMDEWLRICAKWPEVTLANWDFVDDRTKHQSLMKQSSERQNKVQVTVRRWKGRTKWCCCWTSISFELVSKATADRARKIHLFDWKRQILLKKGKTSNVSCDQDDDEMTSCSEETAKKQCKRCSKEWWQQKMALNLKTRSDSNNQTVDVR